MTEDLPRLLSKEIVAEICVKSASETARPLVKKLREEEHCDLVIALTHLGHEYDQALAKAVPGLDAIVGGHSHRRLAKPIVEGSTLIVQSAPRGRELGRLDLYLEGGKLVKHEYKLLPLPLDEASVPTATAAKNAPLAALVKVLDDETIGTTVKALKVGDYYGQTDCGSFVADAIRAAAQADVGFINRGGVRAEFPEGKVSRAALMMVMPFDDELGTFEATGAELEAICLYNARATVTRDHGILQLSGVRYKWRRKGEKDAEVVEVTVGGKPLDREKTYLCATNEYLLFEQAGKYFGKEPRERKKLTTMIVQALEQALKAGPIEPPDHGRILEVDATGSEAKHERAGATEGD
jgi:2',3'-cyclic-nucleotide 2'-phosphodiesterase (5'-nucleotidase family)